MARRRNLFGHMGMPSRRALQRSSKPSPALAKNEDMRRFEPVIRLRHNLDRLPTPSGDGDHDHQSFSFSFWFFNLIASPPS